MFRVRVMLRRTVVAGIVGGAVLMAFAAHAKLHVRISEHGCHRREHRRKPRESELPAQHHQSMAAWHENAAPSPCACKLHV